MSETHEYTLPELPYAYDDLEPAYASEMLELHHDKHHATYVKGVNAALASLAEARRDADYSAINQLEKDLAFNLSGHVLHSIFWRNMSPQGGGDPNGALAADIESTFGGADTLRDHLSRAATSIQGSGWSALCYEPLNGRLLVQQIYDHQGNFGNGTMPLLVLDMWEHAYYLQYRNEKGNWVEKFWELVDWDDVARRYERTQRLDMELAA